MKIVKLNCPSCGATLDYDNKIVYCSFCGEKLLLDDEALNVNVTHRKIDEARIKENERKEKIRLKELENQEKENGRRFKILAGFGIFFVLTMSWLFLKVDSEQPKVNYVNIPSSSKEYKGLNYEIVIQEITNAGFTDVTVVAQKDLTIGWLVKDGSVDRISIGGDSDFEEGDYFKEDASVVITYRTFKSNGN